MTPTGVLKDVRVPPLSPERFKQVLTAAQAEELDATIDRAHAALHGRVVWSVNSTMRGGGVAEMLASLIAYSRGAGVDARWVVIRADPAFFEVTKRLHNRLHGAGGDGRQLGADQQRLYGETCDRLAEALAKVVRPEDIVMLHDPQTAGMVGRMKRLGATVIWRSHVGADLVNDLAEEAWRFLLPHVREADAYVFSREAFAWADLDPSKVAVVPPSIDAFSPKNQPMDEVMVAAMLRCSGLESGRCPMRPSFERLDGTRSHLDRSVRLDGCEPFPSEARVLAQVSRWDRLKDHAGVLRAFCDHMASETDAHLVLAGPEADAVADDPEGEEVLAEIRGLRSSCPESLRDRIHVASLPMSDPEANAAIVNALQRRASVIAQKSLAEGFGLTVAEAMWKGKAVIASQVGGISDQIEDRETGALVDSDDLEGFAERAVRLLGSPDEARRLGTRAREAVRDRFLGPRQLRQYVDLFERLLG